MALLIWEILALKNTPNHRYQPREYFERVVKGNERPEISRGWPGMCKIALSESWVADPQKRPTIKKVAQMIRSDLNDMSEDSRILSRTRHMKDRSDRSLGTLDIYVDNKKDESLNKSSPW